MTALAVQISNETEFIRREMPDNLQWLARIARNYWWSWTADGAGVFRDLDPNLWEHLEQNPLRLLHDINELRLWQCSNDAHYVSRVENLTNQFDNYLAQTAKTFSGNNGRYIAPEKPVAYFCAEYGVHNSLPLYSGGLGILAGDHLKSASDLQVPLVAVGLFYRFGYFRQKLSSDGYQLEDYRESRPSDLAIEPVFDENGERLTVNLIIRGRVVFAQVWLARIGRIPLYLLDTDVEQNEEVDRVITGYLYGGDTETRVVQEMVLGIGGVRLLRKLKIEPSVYHLNEGHSAFLTLELAREYTESEEKLSLSDAMPLVRDKCVFTTHTPVAAGNDEFSPELIEKCLNHNWMNALGLSAEDFYALGRTNPNNPEEWYGMTPLSLRMCRSANGVSRKHGEVSRSLWHKMFAPAKVEEVPISHVTNGVHAPTWIAPHLQHLYIKHFGENWAYRLENQERWKESLNQIPNEELWRVHNLLKRQLIAYVRQKTAQAREQLYEPTSQIEAAKQLFESHVLTIGFARRVAGYKRWNLLLHDPERLLNLIDNIERPVQFVFAGKAHPQDRQAKAILQDVVSHRQHSAWERRAVFIQDYDKDVARYLVQGVDVWLNVPRRPLEASGTSGQKVSMNGGLNFSILDGWWIEGYDGLNGWAIGDEGLVDGDELSVDVRDANSLYQVLENEIVPTYYERDENNLPRRWIEMMRHSLQTLTYQFSSDRMLLDYIQQIYC